MSAVDAKGWDHILGPINTRFFDDYTVRDKMFGEIRRLDEMNALDDLADVITALNETNFYDAFNDLFECAEDPDLTKCEQRDVLLSKEEILHLIKILNPSRELLDAAIIVADELVNAIGKDPEKLRREILNFYDEEVFNLKRLDVVGSVANRFRKGMSSLDKSFISQALRVQDYDGNAFLRSWINDPYMDHSLYVKLLTYFLGDGEWEYSNIRGIVAASREGVSCHFRDGEELRVNIDIAGAAKESFALLTKKNYLSYLDYLLDTIALTRIAEPFCPQVIDYSIDIVRHDSGELETVNASLFDTLGTVVALAEDIPFYDVLRLVSLVSQSINNNSDDADYLLRVIDGEIFYQFLEVAQIVYDFSPELFESLYAIQKSLPNDFYFALGTLLEEFFYEYPEETLSALGKLWEFYSTTEQNFLFNFIDRHLKDDANFVGLFEFYIEVVKLFSPFADYFGNHLAGNESNRNKTYNSLRDLVKHHSGANVLDDMSQYFSRDYIIKTIQILSRGVSIPSGGSLEDWTAFLDRFRSEDLSVDLSGGSSAVPSLRCASSLLTRDSNFYDLIVNMPNECREVSSSVVVSLMFDMKDAADDFSLYVNEQYERDYSSSNFLSEGGLLSKANLKDIVVLVKSIENSYGGRLGNGLEGLFRLAQLYWSSNQDKNEDGIISHALKILLPLLGDQNRNWRNEFLYRLTSSDTFLNVKKITNLGATLLAEYESWIDFSVEDNLILAQDPRYTCKNFLNHQIGDNICPTSSKVTKNIERIIELLLRENDGAEKTALGFLLDSISSDGILIPFGAKARDQRAYQMTLKETLQVVFSMSDQSNPVNRKVLSLYVGGNETDQRLTTTERVENVIRNVWFDNNYLGAHYQNSVARTFDYNTTVSSRGSLMSFCSRLRFCGKYLNRAKRRMASNAIESFGGLLDSNTIFNRGDYMQALQSIIVASSSERSSRDTVVETRFLGVPLTVPHIPSQRDLKQHNGEILFRLAELGSFSHLARFTKDRFGRTNSDFNKFLSRDDFNSINKNLTANLNEPEIVSALALALDKSIKIRNQNGENLVDYLVRKVSEKDYLTLRKIENQLGKGISLLSLVSHRESTYGPEALLLFAPKLVENWPLVADFIEELDSVDLGQFIDFLHHKAFSSTDFSRELVQEFTGRIFKLAMTVMLPFGDENKGILDIYFDYLDDEGELNVASLFERVSKMYDNLRSNDDLDSLLSLLQTLSDSDGSVSFEGVREYLLMSTYYEFCNENESHCVSNPNYDEPFMLIGYLLDDFYRPNNIDRLLAYILNGENSDDLIDFLNKLLPHLRVEENTQAIAH